MRNGQTPTDEDIAELLLAFGRVQAELLSLAALLEYPLALDAFAHPNPVAGAWRELKPLRDQIVVAQYDREHGQPVNTEIRFRD